MLRICRYSDGEQIGWANPIEGQMAAYLAESQQPGGIITVARLRALGIIWIKSTLDDAETAYLI